MRLSSRLTRCLRSLSLAALLLGIGAPAHAGPLLYTTLAAFLAAVSNPGTDTFESLSGNTPSPLARTAGAYGYQAATSVSTFYGAGTAADRWLSTDYALETVTFNSFSAGVAGIGGFFFGSDFSGAFKAISSITVVATDASGATSSTLSNASTTTFLGFVSTTAIASLTVLANQPAGGGVTWPTVNNLILAQAAGPSVVPEPGSIALLGLGAVAVLFARKRRRV